jgi:hypothetical protein
LIEQMREDVEQSAYSDDSLRKPFMSI